MKKLILFAGLMCVLELCAGKYARAHSRDDISEIAREAVMDLTQENYAALFARFDDTMKSAMPPSQLSELWKTIIAQAGGFKSIGEIRQERAEPYDVVFVTCQFERAPLDVELDFNAKQQIADLFFSPASRPSEIARAITEPFCQPLPGSRARPSVWMSPCEHNWYWISTFSTVRGKG